VLALPNTKPGEALVTANRLLKCMEGVTISDSNMMSTPRITISIGIANLTPGREMGKDELVRLADKAMLQAKAEGRNRLVVA
jgi:diguanylate cyclase (GGDEF)-like protein